MKDERCPYKRSLLCQKESGCLDCEIYYLTMPVPPDGRTVEEIEQANSRLFGAKDRIMLDNDNQMLYTRLVDDTNGKFEGEL